jgi:hypothetical protein
MLLIADRSSTEVLKLCPFGWSSVTISVSLDGEIDVPRFPISGHARELLHGGQYSVGTVLELMFYRRSRRCCPGVEWKVDGQERGDWPMLTFARLV